MHPAFFGIKRWHLRIVETSKRLMKPFGVTPARFDLMRIVAVREGALQRNIVWMLGVSNATVSRMLKSLRELGYVYSETSMHDARCNDVKLTPLGWDVYQQVKDYCIDSRKNEQMAAAAITNDRYANVDSKRVRQKVVQFEDFLLRGRKVFRDASPVRHPWSDADFVSMEFFALERDINPYPLMRRPKPKAPSPKDRRPWEIPPPWPLPSGPTAFMA